MRFFLICGAIGLFVASGTGWAPRPAAAQGEVGQTAAAQKKDEAEDAVAAPDFAALFDDAITRPPTAS